MQATCQRKKAVQCYSFLILLTFNGNIHFAGKLPFKDLSSVWKDDLAIRFSSKLFQMTGYSYIFISKC